MNAFFTLVKQDTRLKSSHISLYMALFQYWNFNRFQNPFPVYRDNIMKLSKIGSKNTYHECIKELHEAKYIYYHPSTSRFLPVKVSIGRLDIEEEPPSRYKQLDIFDAGEEGATNSNEKTPAELTPSPLGATVSAKVGEGLDEVGAPCPKIGTDKTGQNLENTCPKFDTDSVPYLTATCPKNDTVPVPKMGHNIKHKHFIKESKQPAQKIFDKNEKLSEAVNKLAGVPNSVHSEKRSRSIEGLSQPYPQPHPNEVTEFFKQQNYPDTEAQKFFNHYKAIGWKIKGITPIEDWQAAAHKWMLNAKKWDPETSYEDKSSPSWGNPATQGLGTQFVRKGLDIQTLYSRFLAGNNVFKQITQEHFTELKLELSDEVLKHARQERINQLTGSNQNAVLQLLQAYQTNKENDPLLIKDQETHNALARRIAVIHHFHHQKQSGSEIP